MTVTGGRRHNGCTKVSSAMALMAARSTSDGARRLRSVKRRPLADCSALPHKRPRTSRGKPHSNLAALLRPPFAVLKQEAAASSSADEDYPSPLRVPSSSDFASFIHTEPLQNLCVKSEEEDYDGAPLHRVPTFFPIEHLLSTKGNVSADFDKLRCGIFQPPSSLSSPISPLSSSPLCSSGTDEYSGDNALSWEHYHEVSCDFLNERFYEIERDMMSIMGEAVQDATSAQPSAIATDICRAGALLVPKMEESDCSESTSQSDTSTSLAISTDSGTTGATTEFVSSDEDYRIDLTDFEPGQGECSDGDCEQKLFTASRKLSLSLNYEEVITAWSDRGSLFADGSWGRAAPEDYDLDLAAWEPESHVGQSFEFVPEAGKMILLGPSDGMSILEDGTFAGGGGGSVSGREARVLRYREKRRTRLFSKKTRYEVRKLNAERRPRMKGRFIKRSTLD